MACITSILQCTEQCHTTSQHSAGCQRIWLVCVVNTVLSLRHLLYLPTFLSVGFFPLLSDPKLAGLTNIQHNTQKSYDKLANQTRGKMPQTLIYRFFHFEFCLLVYASPILFPLLSGIIYLFLLCCITLGPIICLTQNLFTTFYGL